MTRRSNNREGPEVTADVEDPGALVQALQSNDRFQRDTRMGRIFHPGKISFRELSDGESLHITIRGSRVSAHLDKVCPLRFNGRSWRYSVSRVLAHNLAGIVADTRRWVRHPGRRERCTLDCDIVWVAEEAMVGLMRDREPEAGAAQAG